MSDLTTMIMAFAVACLAIAVGVWVFVKTNLGTDQTNARPSGMGGNGLNERRSMQVSDWINASVNIVLGVLLGIVIDGLVQLATTALWPMALLIPLLFAGIFLFDGLFDRLVEKIFPSGIRPASKPKAKSRAPWPRLLSLPVGIIVGIALARLGFSSAILGWLS